MSFDTEFAKLQRVRRAFLRFAQEENSATRLWVGKVDRRYAKTHDDTQLIPLVGTVNSFGTWTRSLANYMYSLETPTLSISLFDPDGEWAQMAGGLDDQLLYRNLSLWLRVHDDTGANIYDRRVGVVQVKKPSFPAGGGVDLDCQVTSGAVLGDTVPRRFITTTDFTNAPAESQGLRVPFIYGVQYNEVSAFVLPDEPAIESELPGHNPDDPEPTTLPPITGTEKMECGDLWSDDFESGALTGYTGAAGFTVETGAGEGGSKSARPAAAGNLLTRVVSPPRRGFCISWSSDHDQAESTGVVDDALTISRVGTAVTVDVPIYGQLVSVAGVLAPGLRQKLQVQGAFATQNFTTTLAADMSAVATTLTVATGDGAKFTVGKRVWIGTEVLQVQSKAGDVITALRARGESAAAAHASGTTVQSRDQNGYLTLSVNGVVRVALSNEDRLYTNAAGSWTTVDWGPNGDGDNLTIGSGINFLKPEAEEPEAETSPFAGDPLKPAPTPTCPAESLGGGSPSGGAVKAILVGGYITSETESGGPTTTGVIPPPVISAELVGGPATDDYTFVVTSIAPGTYLADHITEWGQLTNHVGESNASNQVTVRGPSHPDKDNYVHVHWTPVAGALGFYRVYMKDPDGNLSLMDLSTDDTHYNFGEINGRTDVDIPKTECHPPSTNMTGTTTGGGGGATVNNLYVLAGHALKEVTEVYVKKPVVISDFSETGESSVPTRSEPVQVLQTEGVDYTQGVRDINGRRYHVLEFVAAQMSETCEYYEVTANVLGAETNGDTTGALIENAADITEHILLNWVFNSYEGGRWFTDVPYAPGLINHDSVVAAKLVAGRRLFGGYVGSGYQAEAIMASELVLELLKSYDLEFFFDNSAGPAGAWFLKMFDPTVTRGTLPHYTQGDVILENSFSADVDVERLRNVFPFFAGPTSQTTGKNSPSRDGSGGWLISGAVKSDISIERFGLSVNDAVYLRWTRDPATAYDVVSHYRDYQMVAPIVGSFTAVDSALLDPLATLVEITHPRGVGRIGGWARHVCKVIRSDINLDRVTGGIQFMSVDRLIL